VTRNTASVKRFYTDTLAGTTVVGEKTVWLQGATLGLEARW
jgi:hypothetical protein